MKKEGRAGIFHFKKLKYKSAFQKLTLTSMSSEFDLSTDLAVIQARLNGAFDGIHEILAPSQSDIPITDMEKQLEEQTRQMKEMERMMKIMMGLAMPLLEEQANKLRKEKEAEAEKKVQEAIQNDWKKRQEQIVWTKRGAFCHEYGCGGRISEYRPNSNQVMCCLCTKLYIISEQRPLTDPEKSYMEAFLGRSSINAEAAKKESQDYKLKKEKEMEALQKIREEKWEQKEQFAIWIEKEKEKKLQKKEKSKTEWSCPNDGCAHEWKHAGKLYARTFEGDIWEWAGEELGKWVGKWNQQRKEIDTTVPEPEFEDEDESTTEEVRKAEEARKQKLEKENLVHRMEQQKEKERHMRAFEVKEQRSEEENQRKKSYKFFESLSKKHNVSFASPISETDEEKEKKTRPSLPMGNARGDFYQEKSQTWWRCPADDKLHVFRWEKGGSELLVNWKGEAWVCRRKPHIYHGLGDIQYEFANESNWIGVYVRGEDRWDSTGPPRSANIPPPPSGPSYPNGFPGDTVPPPIYRPINFPRGSW
jgi:hypothetical protein